MKKIAILFLIIAMIVSISINSYAKNIDQANNHFYNDQLSSILSQQMSKMEREIIDNRLLYDNSLDWFSLDNKPIVKVYNEIYWNISNTSIKNIVTRADKCNCIDYVVFDNEDIRLRKLEQNNNTSIGLSPATTTLSYIYDLKNTGTSIEIFGESCKINNIYCFDAFTSYMGATIYFCTDKGNYVKYYENETSSGVWFTEEEYGKSAIEYYNYLISPENNYNDNGELVGGGKISFLSFVNLQNDISNSTIDLTKSITYICLIPLVMIGYTLYFIYRDRRIKLRKNNL